MTVAIPLTADECDDLRDAEAVIRRGMETFVEVGTALAAIRDRRLYRQTHTTFEAYCSQQWSLSRPHTYRMIEAAEIATALSPMGDTPVPTNERQARALVGLPPEQAAQVMRAADLQTGGKVTAKAITEVRESRTPVRTPQPETVRTVDDSRGETGTARSDLPAETRDPTTDFVPADSVDSPAAIAAAAIREARSAPASVFGQKLVPDLRRWRDWLRLPEVGGPANVAADLFDRPEALDPRDTAAYWLSVLEDAERWISECRTALRRGMLKVAK